MRGTVVSNEAGGRESLAATKTSKPKTAEMHPGPGFRMRLESGLTDPEVIAGFAEFDTPAISDLMNRLFTMALEIKPLTDPALRILGPACTVKVFPGDN